MRDESAGHRAREVIGLYGDPDTTWGIALELGFEDPLDASGVEERAGRLVASYPHLGHPPSVVVTDDWEARREEAAATPYRTDEPLVRLVLGSDGRRLLVAAHHGVCDGLGLVAIADRVSDRGLVSRARGIGDRPAPRSFLASSVARVGEALLRPPPRFGSHRPPGAGGEHLRVLTQDRTSTGTVDLCLALATVFADWNDSDEAPLFVSGASRREAGTLEPDRRTAYLRFRFDPAWDRDRARAAFAALAPEPEFPETSAGGIGPRAARLLRNRLGGTAQVSNLGVVEGSGLVSAAMFPALSGPRGLAVGLVSTTTTTTVSLRTRGSEFAADDTEELLRLVAERIAAR